MKHFVSALLCTALCALTVVPAWGVTPALTGDTTTIPLLSGPPAVAASAIVVLLTTMNKTNRKLYKQGSPVA